MLPLVFTSDHAVHTWPAWALRPPPQGLAQGIASIGAPNAGRFKSKAYQPWVDSESDPGDHLAETHRQGANLNPKVGTGGPARLLT